MKQVSDYQAKKRQDFLMKNKKESFTKLLINFHDGNSRAFYSWDVKGKKKDKQVGIYRLEQMLFNTFKGKWKLARLYNNNEQNGDPIHRYENGGKVW